LLMLLKHMVFGIGNLPRILFGTGRLTDPAVRKAIVEGGVEYPVTVDVDLCMGCGLCSRICPMKCIEMKPLPEKIMLRENQYKDIYPEIESARCMFCFQCHDNCPVYTVHNKAAAIHPRGVRKTGIKAQDLFKADAGGATNA